MFKFLKDDSPDGESGQETLPKEVLRSAAEIKVKDIHYQLGEKVPFAVQSYKSGDIKYIVVAQLLRSEFLQQDDRIKSILDSTSDLIPGVYEGGFKIWECTSDLIKYMEESNVTLGENTQVLDLGCGSGVLGLNALGKGAFVDFQDYNSEVIDYLTVPNVILNFKDQGLLKCRFYAGDWGALREQWVAEDKKYDVILSSETIYNLESLPKFVQLVKDCLKPDGCLLLAAKTCYFGVGGGTLAFNNLISNDSSLTSEVVQVIRQGVQREIIRVTHKK